MRLPLTEGALELRKKEGKQRRSVVDLVEIEDWKDIRKSKDAIEVSRNAAIKEMREHYKGKLAPIRKGQISPTIKDATIQPVRAYARPVTIDGRRYWRVSSDLQKPGGPLTMAEYLYAAPRETQRQVLGARARQSLPGEGGCWWSEC